MSCIVNSSIGGGVSDLLYTGTTSASDSSATVDTLTNFIKQISDYSFISILTTRNVSYKLAHTVSVRLLTDFFNLTPDNGLCLSTMSSANYTMLIKVNDDIQLKTEGFGEYKIYGIR